MEKITNEKVLALYHAVWEMIQEGQNVYKMKVIDITNRAGIGKGTAYEYFRSKEEIVDRALHYYSTLEYEQIRGKLEGQESLKAAFEVCFDWLDQYQNRMEGLIQLIKNVGSSEGGLQKGIARMEATMPEGTARVQILLRGLVGLGRKDGLISDEVSDELAGLQILSQMMGYFSFTKFAEAADSDRKRAVREFLYQAVLTGLSA